MKRSLALPLILLGLVVLSACGSGTKETQAHPPLSWTPLELQRVALPVTFAPTPKRFVAQCRSAARAVGHPVPCPMRLPRGMQGTPPVSGDACPHYRFKLLGLACTADGAKPWRGWLVGSLQGVSTFVHLVTAVSPSPANYAVAVNGPVATSGMGPKLGGWLRVRGQKMRWAYVDPLHNDGSAFMKHVALVWTTGGHTYAYGFHAIPNQIAAAAMDYRLALSLRLVGRSH